MSTLLYDPTYLVTALTKNIIIVKFSKIKIQSDDIPEDRTGDQQRQQPNCLTETSHDFTVHLYLTTQTVVEMQKRENKTFMEKATEN